MQRSSAPLVNLLAFLVSAAWAQAQTPIYEVQGAAPNEHFGEFLHAAGDVNLDGVVDTMAVGYSQGTQGVARLLSGLDGSALWSVASAGLDDLFGYSGGAAGDVNGDGVPDVFLAAPLDDPSGMGFHAGAAWVLSGLDGSALYTFLGQPLDNVGYGVAGVGDLDGDGRADFAVGSPQLYAWSGAGSVTVYSGASGAVLLFVAGDYAGAGFGVTVTPMGDMDGDLVPDFALGAGDLTGYIRLTSGANGAVIHQWTGGVKQALGSNVVGGQDINGDGVPDLAYGTPVNYMGVYSGSTHAEFWTFATNTFIPYTTVSARALGDVNGDGMADVAVHTTYDLGQGFVQATFFLEGSSGAVQFGLDDPSGYGVELPGDVNADGVVDWLSGRPYGDPQGLGRVIALTLERGTSPYGSGTPGCNGPGHVAPHGPLSVPSPTFGLTSSGAPANALGLCLVGNAASPAGMPFPGIGVVLLVDLLGSTEILTLNMVSGPNGLGFTPAAIPNLPQLHGAVYHTQALWYWGGACAPSTSGLTSSNGLTIQIP
jgi:hypothetical protein